jgi:hypothetical protein
MLGGWIGALVVGIVLVMISPHVPHPAGIICRIIGWVLLIVALILFLLWLLALLGVMTAVGAAVPLLG